MRIKAFKDKYYIIPYYSRYRINKYSDILDTVTNQIVEKIYNGKKVPKVQLLHDDDTIHTEKVDKLMMHTFCGRLDFPINHIDGDKINCENENLEFDLSNVFIKLGEDEITVCETQYKKIPYVKNRYISSDGVVFSTFNNKFLKIDYDKGDYAKIRFRVNEKEFKTFMIHVLVYEIWNSKYDKSKYEINHIDSHKNHKWKNSVSNLELVTRLENIQHAEKYGLRKPNKWTIEQVEMICDCISKNITARNCAKILGITEESEILKLIHEYKDIRFGKSYKHISEKYDFTNFDPLQQRRESCNKLTEDEVNNIYDLIFIFKEKDKVIANKYGISRETVRDMRTGKRRKKDLDAYMKRKSMSSTTIETNL